MAADISRRAFLTGAVGLAALGAGSGQGTTEGTHPSVTDSTATDSWMQGFPPDREKVVRFADGTFYEWPQLRWSVNHIQELVPTKAVWRGAGAHRPFVRSPVELDRLAIETLEGRSLSWDEALLETFTDGLVVVHRGELVFERYFAHCDAHARHATMSATKSLVGTLAQELVQSGVLARDEVVPTYIPELADSAWENATVGQVMDMLVSMRFDEDYLNPDSEVYRYLRSAGMLPPRPGAQDPTSFYDYLPTVRPDGRHGRVFAYREPNINVLGWLVRRASGVGLAELLSKRVWQHLGAEHDAYFMVDSTGAETTMSTTLRDFARFGELVRNQGRVRDLQVVSADVVKDIFGGGDRVKFAAAKLPTMKGWSYRSQWWIRHLEDRTCAVARGAHGQLLYVDPGSEIVIARFGSTKESPSYLLDPILIPTIDAIVRTLSAD
jgi:CubicO group peptidase (beta-lactamase class C family)